MDIAEDVKDADEMESSDGTQQHNSMENDVATAETEPNDDVDHDDAEKWSNLMKQCKCVLTGAFQNIAFEQTCSFFLFQRQGIVSLVRMNHQFAVFYRLVYLKETYDATTTSSVVRSF